jgi:hypothetical protein
MDKLEAARLSLTPMRKAGLDSAFGARFWRPMEFQYVTLGFSCDGLLFISLIVPLISSLRRICFFISVLFILLKLPLLHFVTFPTDAKLTDIASKSLMK